MSKKNKNKINRLEEMGMIYRANFNHHIEETSKIVQKGISEKEYAIFRKSERIAQINKQFDRNSPGYNWREIKAEFTEKEKKEFEEKIQKYDEEVAKIRSDLEILNKKLENNTDTTSANIENLNHEIKTLVIRCEELLDKEGFRKPMGGYYEDPSGMKTHWDDFGDDGGKPLVCNDPESNKNPKQFEAMYIGNREWIWLKKPKLSFIQKIKNYFKQVN